MRGRLLGKKLPDLFIQPCCILPTRIRGLFHLVWCLNRVVFPHHVTPSALPRRVPCVLFWQLAGPPAQQSALLMWEWVVSPRLVFRTAQ